jgi:PKD repeat protein
MHRRNLLLLISLLLITFSAASPTALAARDRGDTALRRAAQLQQVAPWISSKESAGIIYFLFAAPPKIERYAVQSQIWLAPIALAAAPTAFTVDADGIYVSFGRSTSRFGLDGSSETHLINTIADVQNLHTIGQFLYLNYINYPYGRITSINKLSAAQIDSKDYLYAMLTGTSVAPTKGKLFGRDTGLSPADIVQVVLNPDGTLGAESDSPYHGDYPSAGKTWVFPGEARVVDDSGIVYNTSNLTYNNSFAGSIGDLAFYGDLPIVLRGSTLIAYSNSFQETGRHTLATQPRNIYVADSFVYAFSFGGDRGVDVVRTSVSALTPSEPGQPVDPNSLAYVPDAVTLSADGIVYLLSRANLSVFRWSVAERRYLPTIPLVEAPSYMDYSDANRRLYLAYPSGKLTQIRLSESIGEQPFANAPVGPCGLATAGEFVFICDPVGAWVSHFTYNPDGALITQKEWNYYSYEYTWSAANRKMYFFRDDTSPNDLIWEDINAQGALGATQDSPYHDSAGIAHPIRVAPDGSIVLLGSGRIYNAITLNLLNSLANDINDATWGNGLFTLRSLNGGSQIQKWGATYSIIASRQTEGQPIRIFPITSGKLLITNFHGVPRFSIWDNALNRIFATPTLAGLSASNSGPTAPGQPATLRATLTKSSGPVTYTWAFGDGATGSGQEITHVYTAAGVYTAVVTATNGADLLTATTSVQVVETPIAGLAATNDSPTMLGYSTLLQAQTAGGSNIMYTWAFGDGATGSGATIMHSYSEVGTYTAVVTASNTISTLTATTTVTISPPDAPFLQIAPVKLAFGGVADGENPPAQVFSIRNAGGGELHWSADETMSWLNLSAQQGIAPAVVTATVDLSGLSTGTYSGLITVGSPDVLSGPKTVSVTLVVRPPDSTSPLKLTAESGYSGIKLQWNPLSALDVASYRVARAVSSQAFFTPIASTRDTMYFDADSALVPGTQYCYRVEALRADGSVVEMSNRACAVMGQVMIWIPETWAAPGQTAIVPVNIRNASGLRIAASDIWLDVDGRVLEPIGIAATPLTAGYTWSYGATQAGTTSRIRIATLSTEPPALHGDGSLFWLTVRVLGQAGDTSPLDLREFVSGVGGSTIYTPEEVNFSVPLNLQDGIFHVASSYRLGDLNGNGVVEAVDAYIALEIASNRRTSTPQQRAAGDVNGNGQVDAGDATMILHYAVYGRWPSVSAGQVSRLPTSAASAVQLALDDVSGTPGATVQATLSTASLSDWAGGTIVVAYDPTIVAAITDVQTTNLSRGFSLRFYDDGAGLLYIALASGTSTNGGGALLHISLKIADSAAAGSTPLFLAQAQLNDGVGRDFASSALNRTIERGDGNLQVQPKPHQPAYRYYVPMLIKP